MALTSYAAFSLDVPAVVVGSFVTGNDVAGGAMGAIDAASVEGTDVDTVGMTSLEFVAMSPM